MTWKEGAKMVLPAIWTFLQIYAVERLADYYYLSDNSAAFFTVSGWRLPLFIVAAVACSVCAGAFLRKVWKAAVATTAALVGFLLTAYSLCDPRVCYSTGWDGLEPLRFGFFLASVMISGSGLGVAIRKAPMSRASRIVTSFFGLAAIGFYPLVFSFAGARLLEPFDPWAAAAVVATGCASVSVAIALDLGARWGFALPIASLAAVTAVSAGISAAYFTTIVPVVLVILVTGVGSSGAGALFASRRKRLAQPHRRVFSSAFAFCIVFVLLMMIVAVPDEVNGVVPTNATGAESFTIGTPVYSGGYMDASPGHAQGAGVTVSFNGTDPRSIQPDNYLSAGFGIHAAGCCVDGIDYSYRFDVYLFHSGNATLVASAWEACDDNAACGGHSWKVLMYLHSRELVDYDVSSWAHLSIQWTRMDAGYGVLWTDSLAGGPTNNFTQFVAPAAENHDFNTGVLPGGTLGPGQTGSYFFQFGVMSSYPVGNQGWRVSFACPSLLALSWGCIPHAKTVEGSQSFWKVFWRWGEDYPHTSTVATGPYSLEIAYSPIATKSFVQLW
jgi:hypothetical protein